MVEGIDGPEDNTIPTEQREAGMALAESQSAACVEEQFVNVGSLCVSPWKEYCLTSVKARTAKGMQEVAAGP